MSGANVAQRTDYFRAVGRPKQSQAKNSDGCIDKHHKIEIFCGRIGSSMVSVRAVANHLKVDRHLYPISGKNDRSRALLSVRSYKESNVAHAGRFNVLLQLLC
jgi:hypothetical protein